MNEGEFPSPENNESFEPSEESPEEAEQWTAEDETALEQAAALDRKKVNEELSKVRELLGLDPNGPEEES